MPLSIQFLATGLSGQLLSGTMMPNSILSFLLYGELLFALPKSLRRDYQLKTAMCACCFEESMENELYHMAMETWGRGGVSGVQCNNLNIPQQ